MPGLSGFQMLEKLDSYSFQIIFTTAYDQHALMAIRAGALDYLLKPIDKDELAIAVDKAVRNEHQISLVSWLPCLHKPVETLTALSVNCISNVAWL